MIKLYTKGLLLGPNHKDDKRYTMKNADASYTRALGINLFSL